MEVVIKVVLMGIKILYKYKELYVCSYKYVYFMFIIEY